MKYLGHILDIILVILVPIALAGLFMIYVWALAPEAATMTPWQFWFPWAK